MKKICISVLMLLSLLTLNAYGKNDIQLPEVKGKAGMDVIQAIETRAASRSFTTEQIPLEALSTVLWAGNGIILERGSKTVHGYDAVTSATNLFRYTTPWGWEKPYITLHLILKSGIYKYSPKNHELKFIKPNKDAGTMREAGVIVISADFTKIHSSHPDARDVAVISAGSAAQNIYVAGAAYGIQTFTKVYIKKKLLGNILNLPADSEPLVTIGFGYAN